MTQLGVELSKSVLAGPYGVVSELMRYSGFTLKRGYLELIQKGAFFTRVVHQSKWA